MKLKLHFFKGKLHTELHTELHTDCTRITHGLRAVYARNRARIAHEIALFSNCAFRILRSLIDGTHSVVDRVGKIVFLLFHGMLVDIFQHVVGLVAHALHLIFVRDTERVRFRRSKMPKIVKTAGRYTGKLTDLTKMIIEVYIEFTKDILTVTGTCINEPQDFLRASDPSVAGDAFCPLFDQTVIALHDGSLNMDLYYEAYRKFFWLLSSKKKI